MRRNQEPGTANTNIASSACRFPAIRHGMHARMSRLLITNINLAGSWLWNANMSKPNVSTATCTLATFQERPQRNRYFRAISISLYDLTASSRWQYLARDLFNVQEDENILSVICVYQIFSFYFSSLLRFTSIGNIELEEEQNKWISLTLKKYICIINITK